MLRAVLYQKTDKTFYTALTQRHIKLPESWHLRFRQRETMKTKTEWVLKLRRCSTTDTLQKVAERIKKRLSGKELGIFQLAVDHRMAEITMQKLYDEVPFNVWKYIN